MADIAAILAAVSALVDEPDADDWLEGNVVERGRTLAMLKAVLAQLNEKRDWLQQMLVDSMEEDVVAVPGFGRLVRQPVWRSQWKDKGSSKRFRDDLAHAIEVEVALDIATGEIDAMKANIARATMERAWEAIPAFSDVKKYGRDRLGIDMGDYREYQRTLAVVLEEEL